jgi:acetyl esterase
MLDRRILFLQWLSALTGKAFRPDAPVERVRAGYAEMNQRFGMRAVDDVQTSAIEIPLRDGATITAHLHRPKHANGAVLPVLLFFHGGGWVIGDIDCYDHLTRYLAHEGKIAVLSVGYRKGPEHRFPAAFDDAFDALAWLNGAARELQLDPARIAVGGDSAGGALAATLSAYAHERGIPRPAYQYLIYPPLDATERFPSRKRYTRGEPLTPELRKWFAGHFLNSAQDASHPYLTQIDAPNPQTLPPTYLLAAGYDALVDEGRAYADRLIAAGVPTVYDLRPTLAHGFVNFPRIVPEARRALRTSILAVAASLHESE